MIILLSKYLTIPHLKDLKYWNCVFSATVVQDVDRGKRWCDDGSAIHIASRPCSLDNFVGRAGSQAHLFQSYGGADDLVSLRSCHRDLILVVMWFCWILCLGFSSFGISGSWFEYVSYGHRRRRRLKQDSLCSPPLSDPFG